MEIISGRLPARSAYMTMARLRRFEGESPVLERVLAGHLARAVEGSGGTEANCLLSPSTAPIAPTRSSPGSEPRKRFIPVKG